MMVSRASLAFLVSMVTVGSSDAYVAPAANLFAGEFNYPAEVPPPELNECSPPQFVAPDGWLDNLCDEVMTQFNRQDTENPRVSPVALVRCSRGGKTRALHELASALRIKNNTNVAIIYVSFNGQTKLLPWENKQSEPPLQALLQALCRRIMFAALPVGDKDAISFHSFAESAYIQKVDVMEWLDDTKCILLIDDLNLVETAMDQEFALFLKDMFMKDVGRALVFSSHVISVNNKLTAFMESPNERAVITKKLPLAQNLAQAKSLLDMSELTPHLALYLGLVPALLYCSKLNQLPHQRRGHAIEKYVDLGITPKKVETLLLTMLTGNTIFVPEMLRELMDIDVMIVDGNEIPIARWIPYHMTVVLKTLSQLAELPSPMRGCLAAMCEQFETFKTQKFQSGDGWEALFIVTLLVRCMTNTFCSLVPLQGRDGEEPVFWNAPFLSHVPFDCQKVKEFISGIPLHRTKGSISIYYPTHTKFEAYDVILAYWGDDGNRDLYGYQLEEGKDIPETVAMHFTESYLIRGAPTTKDASVRGWITPSDPTLDTFFGESAKYWSPKCWTELKNNS
eukprot:scaffold118117_cov47-Attheya_sp.AAC.1